MNGIFIKKNGLSFNMEIPDFRPEFNIHDQDTHENILYRIGLVKVDVDHYFRGHRIEDKKEFLVYIEQ